MPFLTNGELENIQAQGLINRLQIFSSKYWLSPGLLCGIPVLDALSKFLTKSYGLKLVRDRVEKRKLEFATSHIQNLLESDKRFEVSLGIVAKIGLNSYLKGRVKGVKLSQIRISESGPISFSRDGAEYKIGYYWSAPDSAQNSNQLNPNQASSNSSKDSINQHPKYKIIQQNLLKGLGIAKSEKSYFARVKAFLRKLQTDSDYRSADVIYCPEGSLDFDSSIPTPKYFQARSKEFIASLQSLGYSVVFINKVLTYRGSKIIPEGAMLLIANSFQTQNSWLKLELVPEILIYDWSNYQNLYPEIVHHSALILNLDQQTDLAMTHFSALTSRRDRALNLKNILTRLKQRKSKRRLLIGDFNIYGYDSDHKNWFFVPKYIWNKLAPVVIIDHLISTFIFSLPRLYDPNLDELLCKDEVAKKYGMQRVKSSPKKDASLGWYNNFATTWLSDKIFNFALDLAYTNDVAAKIKYKYPKYQNQVYSDHKMMVAEF